MLALSPVAAQAAVDPLHDGLSEATAAASCWEIKQNDPRSADGTYWLQTSTMEAPGQFFSYAFSDNPFEPLWWSVYYCATGIHALHVVIGMSLIAWCFFRARKGAYGPTHYTMVENTGLYWHLVDLIWIFVFPLFYLVL